MSGSDWDGVNRRARSFWNGPATKVLMALVGVLAFLGTYFFGEIVDIPKTYANKDDLKTLQSSVDKGFEELRAGISDINKYLRGSSP